MTNDSTPAVRCKTHERQYPCHICNPELAEAPADDLVRRLLERCDRCWPTAQYPNVPPCPLCVQRHEAAKEIERLKREPTITRQQFGMLCDRAQHYTSRFLRRTLAAAGITVGK